MMSDQIDEFLLRQNLPRDLRERSDEELGSVRGSTLVHSLHLFAIEILPHLCWLTVDDTFS
jgi:hypothetical protein